MIFILVQSCIVIVGAVAKSKTWRSIAIIKCMDKFRDLGLEILCEFSEL